MCIPFLHFLFFSPSNHVETLNWELCNSTKVQGTLLDLHGPPNGPLNEPSEANFWGPLVKKGPAGSLHGPNWSIFLDRSLANVQTRIYSLVWGQSDIRFQSYKRPKNCGAYLPPPPAGWGLNRVKVTKTSTEDWFNHLNIWKDAKSFKGVSRAFKRCFKDVSLSNFLWYFRETFRMF